MLAGGRGSWRQEWQENCWQDLTMQSVSSSLHSWLLMEQTQLEKKLYMLRQEKKKLLDDWVTGS